MSKYDALFIGTAILDSVIKGFDPEPVSVTGYRADSSSLNIGGEAVNGAIAGAKLGMKTAILCFLGNDVAGSLIETELVKNGVNTEYVVKLDNRPTPITTMFVADNGSRKSITNKAHAYNFHPEQYTDILSNTRAIVLGSLFRAPFNEPEVIRSITEAAQSRGVTVFADTKLPNFTQLALDDISDSLPMIDYITPNEDEARYYSGEDEPEKMADVFLDKGVRNVIIKLGAKGCFFKNAKESFAVPAYSVDAVDATGAGDNFLAGFASEIIRGKNVREALSFANACGAICATAVGASTALRDREQVQQMEWQ